MKVQFRNTITGRTETYDGLTRRQVWALVKFVDELGERAVTELRVRVLGCDARGNAEWADISHQF